MNRICKNKVAYCIAVSSLLTAGCVPDYGNAQMQYAITNHGALVLSDGTNRYSATYIQNNGWDLRPMVEAEAVK